MMKNRILLLLFTLPFGVFAQTKLPLEDLSSFIVGKNWSIAGSVDADFNLDGVLNASKGKGVLVNQPTEKRKSNLLSKFEHGDIDISLEFMMAKHSNSGIYLQGRYEIQLLDSWGVQNPKYSDCGGIYQRRRSNGSQFEGHAPLLNACKAPGTWQKMEISFQAPLFDETGKKIRNAKVISIKLNGYPIHENIELTGPTGGPISEEETTLGPLMIQGDHGAVAFRNIEYTNFEGVKPSLENLKYHLYEGEVPTFVKLDFDNAKLVESTATNYIDLSMTDKEVGWGVVFEGNLDIKEENDYVFHLQASGQNKLIIDGEDAVVQGWSRPDWAPRAGNEIHLTKGIHPFKLMLGKTDGWMKNQLGFFVTSKNMRMKALHQGLETPISGGASPIYADAATVNIVRSFSEFTEDEEVAVLTRVINVGSPNNLHYSYNLENGALIKIWRGKFLDLTPMLNGRGNGQTDPRGPVLALSNDSNYGSNEYRSKGYDIGNDKYPIFRYMVDGMEVTDKIWPVEGKEIKRTINVKGSTSFTIFESGSIQKVSENLYSINNKDFFIRIDEGAETVGFSANKLTARVSNSNLTYSILW